MTNILKHPEKNDTSLYKGATIIQAGYFSMGMTYAKRQWNKNFKVLKKITVNPEFYVRQEKKNPSKINEKEVCFH